MKNIRKSNVPSSVWIQRQQNETCFGFRYIEHFAKISLRNREHSFKNSLQKTAFLSNNSSKILLLFTSPLIWNWHRLRTEKSNPELNNEPCHMRFANRMPLTLDLSFHGNYYKIYRPCLPYGHRDCKSQDNLVKFMDITSNEINLNLLKYFLGLRHWRFKTQIL